MRKLPVLLVLLAIVCGSAYTLFTWREEAAAPTDPWRAVPTTAAVVIELPDIAARWERITGSSRLWEAMRTLPSITALDTLIRRAARTMNDPAVPADVLVAIVPRSDADPDVVAICADPGNEALLRFGEALSATPMRLAQQDAMSFELGAAFPPLIACVHHGLLMIGSSAAVLLEAQERASARNEAGTDSLLTKARAAFGAGADAHLLLNMAYVPRLLSTWFTPQAVDDLHLPEGWASVDVRSIPDAALLGGLFFPRSEDAGLKALLTEGTEPTQLTRTLPASTVIMQQQVINDARRYLTSRTVVDSLVDLFSWVSGPVINATIATDSSSGHYAIFSTIDMDAASRAMGALGCPTQPNAWPMYRDQPMMRLCPGDALERAWGSSFAGFDAPLVAFHEGSLVFCSNEQAFTTLIDAWLDGTTLQQQLRTADLFQRYTTDATRTIWFDAGRWIRTLSTHMREDRKASLTTTLAGWERLAGCLFQIAPASGGGCFLSACITGAPVVGSKPAAVQLDNALWSTALNAPLERTPDVLRDHVTSARMLLMQDSTHRITLVGANGQVLWTRDVDGPILGEVQQVDRFKNGRLQMLFNTSTRIFLIDRNGKDVAGFPIVLKEKASAPLAVFDYENTREYRVLVPTEEAHLLNFGMDGKPTQGWAPVSFANSAHERVRFLRIHGKDHLLVFDHTGAIQVLDRKGAVRYTPKLKLPANARILDIRPAMEIGRAVVDAMDERNVRSSGALEGTLETTPLPIMDPEHVVIADQNGQAITMVAKGDSLFYRMADRSVTITLPAAITTDPRAHLINRRPMISVTCADGNAYVVDVADGRATMVARTKGRVLRVADIDGDGQVEAFTTMPDGTLVAARFTEMP